MTDLRSLLDDLYAEGKAFDATRPDRRDRRRNLEPDAAFTASTVAVGKGLHVAVLSRS